MLARDLHEDNRRSWNSATRAHNSHKGNQAKYLRDGGTTLFPEEIELLGDVADQRLVHLQCNSGQDTLSLAQRGANVTGVDISDEAIDFATRLSADSGIPAEFVRSDVFDWFDLAREAGERFDVVFSSYGTLGWLSDVPKWATGVADVLRAGGRFAIVDFHPVMQMMNWGWQLAHDYWMPEGRPETNPDGVGDYVRMAGEALVPWGYQQGMAEVPNPGPCHEFAWGLGEIAGALLTAGLRLETIREYPWSNGAIFGEGMRELPGRRFVAPAHLPDFPLMYGIAATKPA